MNTRHLGLIAMFTAPALFIIAVINNFQSVDNLMTDPLSAVLYLLFAIGWLCSIIGLRELHATGTSRFGRAIITLPLLTLPFAAMQSVCDLLKVDTSSTFYMLTDIAWPLSMLLTLIVGITVVVANVLPSWQRFVPLFSGLGLPVGILVSIIFGDAGMQIQFPIHTMVGWLLLGYLVFTAPAPAEPRRAAVPAPSAVS